MTSDDLKQKKHLYPPFLLFYCAETHRIHHVINEILYLMYPYNLKYFCQ